MDLGRDDAEPRFLVNPPRRGQHGVGPEADTVIAGLAREADAFVDEGAADAEPPRPALDVKQAELADIVAGIDQQDRARHQPGALGDPALLAAGPEVPQEGRGDLALQNFHRPVPAIRLVEDPLALRDQGEAAGTEGP